MTTHFNRAFAWSSSVKSDDPGWFVAIAGNIGAGKSSLTALLASTFGWKPFYEANAENPYLADFYQEMQRWSFHSQVFFLGKRLEHHHQLVAHPGSAVQDRTVYEDAEIFARNLHRQQKMTDRDYDAYRNLYEAVRAFLPPPHLIVYLQASTPTLLKHISGRGRDYEQNIDPNYVEQLNGLYEEWITDWTACPVLTISLDQLDFVNQEADRREVLGLIRQNLPHIL
jgi:deoxyadenosine/deoxycytidine kinase